MTTDTKSLAYHIYLLSVWRAEDLVLGNETGWRFLLTDTGSRFGFTDSEALLPIIQQARVEEARVEERLNRSDFCPRSYSETR